MEKNLGVSIVGCVGIPARYGGFETLAEQLVKHNYIYNNVDYTVYCSSTAYLKHERVSMFYNAKIVYIPLPSNGIFSVAYDIISILHSLRRSNIILVLGVSGAIILPLLKLLKSKNKIIVHIDGLEWQRSKWKWLTRKFLKFSEKLAVNFSDIVIADNEAIKQYVWLKYKKESSFISYGGDHFEVQHVAKEEFYGFSVCRIEPENMVHTILEAFSKVPHLKLKFVGNWQNSGYGRKLYSVYSQFNNLELINPIYNQKELDRLRTNSDIYVHGHSAGGTNPSLVEAMFAGLPIIAFDVLYNRNTTNNQSLFFKDETELVTILQNVQNIDLDAISKKMKDISNEKYVWKLIATQYKDLYFKLIRPTLYKSAFQLEDQNH